MGAALEQLNAAVAHLESIAGQFGQAEAGAQRMGQAAAEAGEAGADAAHEMGSALGSVEDKADHLSDSLQEAGQTGKQAGSETKEAFEAAGESAEETAEKAKRQFRQMGAEAENFGQAVGGAMGTALKETDSFGKSIKAGFQGAFGYAGKQVDALEKKAKGLGNAFLHPIKTIKGKLADALLRAGKSAKELEDEAKDAEDSLKDLGESGSEAGNAVKDVIKGALGAFIGFEAIKGGISALKNFVGATLEAAAAVESIRPKFEAAFGEAADGASAWAENFSGAVHRSENEVKSFLASSQGMYKGLGMANEEAAELAKITTSLSYDFGTHFRIDDAEALAAVQDAVSGNSEALRDFGIVLDDATLKEHARAMGITQEIGELDEATAAQVRMNAILAQTGDIQRAAIDDTGGLVNSTKSLKGVWGDFMVDAGAKFTPALEKLFGAVLDNWPIIEPMLLGLVMMLSSGMEQAVPILMNLGQTLIPVLTDTLGTLFQAGMPLLSVFGSLAQTILPPVADIFGLLGQTVLPPLVGLLDTLNTAVIQPLMPVLQHMAEAILPALGNWISALSPLLQSISPVIGFIGEMLGVAADFLGKLIDIAAGGIGKAARFFGKLFGGAKESREELEQLGRTVEGLGETDAPEKEPKPAPKTKSFPPPEEIDPYFPNIDIPSPALSPSPERVPVAVGPDAEPILKAPDTRAYTSSVADAGKAAVQSTGSALGEVQAASDAAFEQMGSAAQDTYTDMAGQSESMWQRMTDAAEQGAQKIVEAFRKIGDAALGVSSADIQISGVEIPHHARGTDNFGGGWTHINEEGGEMAFLPQGTAIIPAEETKQIIGRAVQRPSEAEQRLVRQVSAPVGRSEIKVEINMPITIQGNADILALERLEERFKSIAKEAVKAAMDEANEQDYKDLAVQYGFA
jgi:hypothetical protein